MKKSLKKKLSTLLLGGFILATLAGCGSKIETTQDNENDSKPQAGDK